MKFNRIIKSIILISMILALLQSCSSTKLVSSWKNEEFAGPSFKNILVIAVTADIDRKRQFERTFAKKLIELNVEAVPAFRILPIDKKLNKELIQSALEGTDVDAVIVTHVKGVEKEGSYSPAASAYTMNTYYGGFYSYYAQVYDYLYTPGYYQEKVTLFLETNLYDLKNEKLIWTGISESIDPEIPSKVIEPVQEMVIEELYKLKLIE